MIVPNLPKGPVVDNKGNMTELWELFFSQLITALQNNLSNEGIILPQQPTTNIAKLTGPQSIGAVIYDNTLNVAKVNLNGTFKTITTS